MENNQEGQKYFNPKEYATKIVGNGEEQEPMVSDNDKLQQLIELLTDPANKEFREETLLTLKKEKAGALLLAAILSKKGAKHKAQLVAACWESEINFSDKLDFFVDLACDADYLVSLEAMTVIENMEGPLNADAVKKSIKKVREQQKKTENERQVLLNDLAGFLESVQ